VWSEYQREVNAPKIKPQTVSNVQLRTTIPRDNAPRTVVPNIPAIGAGGGSDNIIGGRPPAPPVGYTQEVFKQIQQPKEENPYLKILTGLMQMSPREEQLQKELTNVLQSRDLGIEKVREQPIPTHFITGQSAAIQRQAALKTQPLLEALKLEKAKRQAAIDIAKIKYSDWIKQKETQRKLNAPFTLTPGSARYNAQGELIASVPKYQKTPQEMAREQDIKMLTHGYIYVNTPALRDALKRKGYEIVEIGGRTYAKPPKTTKTKTKYVSKKQTNTSQNTENLFNLFSEQNQSAVYPLQPPNPYYNF